MSSLRDYIIIIQGGVIIIKKIIQKTLRIKGKTLVVLGVGIMISAILMNQSYKSKVEFDIEKRARQMGMIYPEEIKIGDLEREE